MPIRIVALHEIFLLLYKFILGYAQLVHNYHHRLEADELIAPLFESLFSH